MQLQETGGVCRGRLYSVGLNTALQFCVGKDFGFGISLSCLYFHVALSFACWDINLIRMLGLAGY